ncbi:MAG TPA: hypothetical protein VMF57_08635 [Solirubrobacteraceae bacterium]|nr:hypothetical protein [Solirubrobacteraceae bacterium]
MRRHVAKLEAAGWLVREPWIWGEGSVVWLTTAGIEGVGLGGVRPVKSPAGATTISHGVLVGWSAARVEHRGRVWKSARELAVERERWAVKARCERGYTELLPDLAVWMKRSGPPVAVIAESGGRREDRQKMILEAWQDAILSGRNSGVHYHCASAAIAHWISRLAKKVRLSSPTFVAAVQMRAEEIAALSPAAGDEPGSGEPRPHRETAPAPAAPVPVAPLRALPDPTPVAMDRPEPPSPPQVEPVDDAAFHPLYRDVFGTEPKPSRRWRR